MWKMLPGTREFILSRRVYPLLLLRSTISMLLPQPVRVGGLSFLPRGPGLRQGGPVIRNLFFQWRGSLARATLPLLR